MPRPRPSLPRIASLLLAAGCPSDPGGDIEFTAGSSSDGGSSDGGSSDGGTTSSTGTSADASTGVDGCSDDADCVDAPAGPHCDPLTHTCGGACVPGDARPCYTGPSETRGVGVCVGGMRTCTNGNYTRCMGEVKPSLELCNGADDDCDGMVDDLCVGQGGGAAGGGSAMAGGSAGGGTAGAGGGDPMAGGAGGGTTEMPKGCGCSGAESGLGLGSLALVLARRRRGQSAQRRG